MRAFYPIVLTALLFTLGGCRQPAQKAPPNPAQKNVEAKKKPERAMRSDEKTRLASLQAQRAGLQGLVADMKGVVDSLKERDRSEAAFAKQTRGLSPKELEAILSEAKAGMQTSPKGLALSRSAKSIDARLKDLMKKVELSEDAHVALDRERTQIDEIQRTVAQLSPGTNAAFRAHALLIQSELALEVLGKRTQ